MSPVSYSKTVLEHRSRWLLKREKSKILQSVLQPILIILISSYLTVNSVGFGIGAANMKTDLMLKESTHLFNQARCSPPYPTVIKVVIPGFLAGCLLGEKIYNPSN